MIDVCPHHLKVVKRILVELVPGVEVRAFGSRVTGTARETSDLDLAIVGHDRLDQRTLTKLKLAFEESDLPFRVDVVDWQAIDEGFRRIIENQFEIVQEGKTAARRETSLTRQGLGKRK